MIDSEHSKRPMILSIKSVVRARDGSGRPLRERKHISYIFLLRGIRRLRIVLPISRNLRLKFPLKRTKIGRHCKQALYSKSWPAPEMGRWGQRWGPKSWPAPEMGGLHPKSWPAPEMAAPEMADGSSTRDGPEMGPEMGRWAAPAKAAPTKAPAKAS